MVYKLKGCGGTNELQTACAVGVCTYGLHRDDSNTSYDNRTLLSCRQYATATILRHTHPVQRRSSLAVSLSPEPWWTAGQGRTNGSTTAATNTGVNARHKYAG